MTSRCNTLENSYNTTERKLFFVQRDHLGSTIALTDSTGNIIQSYAYDVYGTPYIATGTGFTQVRDFVGNLHGNDRFYTGREYEVSTGLYYYRARFYSAELGRFISRDPIGMGDDVNLYAYVGNSPMMGVDPSGMVVDKKDAQDQKEFFEGQKNRARQAIESFGKNITLRQTEASLRSFSCKYDNIKCNESWMSVAYDKNKGTPAEPEGVWLAVIIDGKEITLDKLGGYFVGYNGKYGGKTLNNTNGSIFTDIYGAGKYVEKYGYEEDDKGEGDSWFMRSDNEVEDDEKDDRPFYDKGYNDAATEICNSKLLVKPN